MTDRNQELFDRAAQVFPGGFISDVLSFVVV
jgi:glutamate-1-semialdehyde aminotransferase